MERERKSEEGRRGEKECYRGGIGKVREEIQRLNTEKDGCIKALVHCYQ